MYQRAIPIFCQDVILPKIINISLRVNMFYSPITIFSLHFFVKMSCDRFITVIWNMLF